MPAKPFILIATPCYGGLVTQDFMESILRLMTYAAPRGGFEFTLAMNGQDSLITRSRNKLVATFLDFPQATHLMFIDADIGFAPESVVRLLEFNQDVVAGMYPIKNVDWPVLQSRLVAPDRPLPELGLNFVGTPLMPGEREEKDGFVTGYYAGTGFMLIKRAVLERMCLAYPGLKYEVAHTWPRVKQQSPNQYALFDCMIEPDTKIYLSEDFSFCRRWRDLGGKIWLDTQTRLLHVGGGKFEGTPRI